MADREAVEDRIERWLPAGDRAGRSGTSMRIFAGMFRLTQDELTHVEPIPAGRRRPRDGYNAQVIKAWFLSEQEAPMVRLLIGIIVGAALGIGGMTLADPDRHGKAKVTTLSEQDIAEKLDGKDARATVVEVTLGPGEGSQPHRHPGPVFGYVLEGEYEWGLGENPRKTLKAGETFYEPTRSLHRVSRNPSTTTRTRVLAVLLHSRDAKELVIPEERKKE
jgi:quercetin dioxygenase-like cupin family protein